MHFEVFGLQSWCVTWLFISRNCQIIWIAPRNFISQFGNGVTVAELRHIQCVHHWERESECSTSTWSLRTVRNASKVLKVFQLMMITIKSEKIFSIMKLNLTLNLAKSELHNEIVQSGGTASDFVSKRIPLFRKAIVVRNVFGPIFGKLSERFQKRVSQWDSFIESTSTPKLATIASPAKRIDWEDEFFWLICLKIVALMARWLLTCKTAFWKRQCLGLEKIDNLGTDFRWSVFVFVDSTLCKATSATGHLSVSNFGAILRYLTSL